MTNNAQSLYDQLKAAGMNTAGALAVTGNVLAESSANPAAVGDSGTSHGLAQWHLGRWDQLVTWAKKLGKNPASFGTQSAYLVQDIQSYNGGSLWRQLTQTQDVYTASNLFMSTYERPKVANAAAADAKAKARADLAINAGLTNDGKPLVNVDAKTLQPDTSGTATATGGTWAWKGLDLSFLNWKTWATKALFLVLALGLVFMALMQLTAPAAEKIAKVAL